MAANQVKTAERKAAKIEFAASANNFKEAALELTRAWERIEMATGDTPSDVAGYPFKESFDELVLAIIDWNHNINQWANKEYQCGCDGEGRCEEHRVPVSISDLANHIIGREAKTGEDFAEAHLAMMGGCLRCGASIACYNAYPSKSGYWMCGDCIGDVGEEGYATVEEARAAIFPGNAKLGGAA